jgi:hypothetical protein
MARQVFLQSSLHPAAWSIHRPVNIVGLSIASVPGPLSRQFLHDYRLRSTSTQFRSDRGSYERMTKCLREPPVVADMESSSKRPHVPPSRARRTKQNVAREGSSPSCTYH